jgi:polyisoprenyl-phosphate glycosyltransferase
MTRTAAPEISVVIPTYGCRDCLRPLHRRLTATLRTMGVDYEVVFVDDRSPDDAWSVLVELAAEDPHVRAVRLSRNFGQQAAITAGLQAARGNWVVVMDCDLQQPPEAIADLYAKAQEGYDVVFARKRQRHNTSIFRGVAARVYFRFQKTFLGNDLTGDYASFSILSRRVRDEFLRINDQDRHYLPIIRWLGFEQGSVDFEHAPRYAGKTSYSLRRLLALALEGVFFQTTTLLVWIVWLGFALALSGVLLAAYFIYSYLSANPYPGWTSLAVLLLVIGGFIIISTGVTGLYIGTIFKQVKGRPLFVVDTEIGGAEAPRTTPAARPEAAAARPEAPPPAPADHLSRLQ